MSAKQKREQKSAGKGKKDTLDVGNVPSDLPAAELSDNARVVLERRYLKRNQQGTVQETPEQMFWRVARVIAEVDRDYGASEGGVESLSREFYRLMALRVFQPNSPTLMNAGRPLGQLSACFVLPVSDSLSNGRDGIYDTLRAMALVHQSGGGTGFSFSGIRPKGDYVRSTQGVASGPISFMSLYDASTEVVKQGGTRRGANMGILRVDHPDIREFIACKNDLTKVTNFNISVAVTDDFMAALQSGSEYELLNPRTGEVAGHESAQEIFQLIVEGAWASGEPGVFYVDRAEACNPVPHLGSYEATNPCGEQPLLPYDVCNLGSINVGRFALEGQAPGAKVDELVDWEELRRVVHVSTHFLDNVIDANQYPLPEIRDLAMRIRRVGLGVMGWADLLVRLGVPYDSEPALDLARRLMGFVDEEAKRASERLAERRGVFPEWERSTWGPDETCARDSTGQRKAPERRLRNCNVTTIAPTGTISIIAECSGGIEPLFAVAFMRNQAGAMMPEVNGDFVRVAKEQGWYSEDLMERIASEGHISFAEVPETVRRVFVTAHDVLPEWHIRMQAAFQEHVDSAISKTCNFSREATEEHVQQIFVQAFQLGCKGVTVYRDGSRPAQVLSTGRTAQTGRKDATDAPDLEAELADTREELHRTLQELALSREKLEESEGRLQKRRHKRTRPELLRGTTRRMRSPLGDLYVTINEDEHGRAFELFATLGKAGGAAMADVEAIGRLVSLALRSGIAMQEVHNQLRGISCDRAVGLGSHKVLSVPDAIAQAIAEHERERAGIQQELPIVSQPRQGALMAEQELAAGFNAHDAAESFLGSCPDCASELRFMEGCMKCETCGYSECG